MSSSDINQRQIIKNDKFNQNCVDVAHVKHFRQRK